MLLKLFIKSTSAASAPILAVAYGATKNENYPSHNHNWSCSVPSLYVNKHIKKIFDDSLGLGKPIIAMSVGTKRYMDIRDSLSHRFSGDLSEAPKPINDCISYSETAIGLKEEMEEKMLAFSSQELDDFVRPIFEEDEWILYTVGGALGFIAGWCQLILMFWYVNTPINWRLRPQSI